MKNLALAAALSSLLIAGTTTLKAPPRAAGDGVPVGTIVAWGGELGSIPAGWMWCNGKGLKKSAYPELFAALGASWGSVGEVFNLPDLRGRFLRGYDQGAGRDPDVSGRKPSAPGGSATGAGTVQDDSVQNHTHGQNQHNHTYYNHPNALGVQTGSSAYAAQFAMFNAASTTSTNADIKGVSKYNTKSLIKTGEESRPKNAAVHYIIKAK